MLQINDKKLEEKNLGNGFIDRQTLDMETSYSPCKSQNIKSHWITSQTSTLCTQE